MRVKPAASTLTKRSSRKALFDPDHVLKVAIEIAPDDWEALRHQVRKLSEVYGEPGPDGTPKYPYTYFSGRASVDGLPLEACTIRKKGFIGSTSISKPSLTISFDRHSHHHKVAGISHLMLNNSNQDPSLIRIGLALKLFRDAGVPASRSNFAHVTVNGKDMGIYVHIEEVNKHLLQRHFKESTGNLYKGQISDLRREFSATYKKKTNVDDPDRSDINAAITALERPDKKLKKALHKVLDVDAFLTFWAMESLLGEWDGYAGNMNNHYIYHDPRSGKMRFIPWCPDATLGDQTPGSQSGKLHSVLARGIIAHRLYATPKRRKRYAKRMMKLLHKVWKEDAILAEIDRMEALLTPYLGESAAVVASRIDEIRTFVKGRREVILAELKPRPPVWTLPLPKPTRLSPLGTVSGTFSTTWGSRAEMNPFGTGTGSCDATIPRGTPHSSSATGAAAGLSTKLNGRAEVVIVGRFPDGKVRAFAVEIDPEVFAAGQSVPFDLQSAWGIAMDVTQPEEPILIGVAGDGAIKLVEATMTSGAPVSGTFWMSLVSSPI